MGVETWNRGNVNVWEPTTNRKVHLEGTGPHTVRSSNKAVTYLTIWDGAGDDDISVGSLNTHTHQRLPSGEFRQALAQELARGQLHLLRRGGQPYAWFSWQLLDAAAHAQRLQDLGADPAAKSVTSPQLWLNYWLRPFGCDARLAQAVCATLQAAVGKLSHLHWHDPSAADGAGKLYLNIDVSMNTSALEQHS